MSNLTTSSGTTAKATTSDTQVEMIAAPSGGTRIKEYIIFNEGIAAGFYSLDGASTWHRLPAGNFVADEGVNNSNAIYVKRTPGGSNLTGLYASARIA